MRSWSVVGASCKTLSFSCSWVLRRSLTSQAISVAFYIEREKSVKLCSETLISAWGSFTFRESTTRDLRLYFPSEGSHTQDFCALKKFHLPRPGLNPRTSDPMASKIILSMITTGPPGSTLYPLDNPLISITSAEIKAKRTPIYTSAVVSRATIQSLKFFKGHQRLAQSDMGAIRPTKSSKGLVDFLVLFFFFFFCSTRYIIYFYYIANESVQWNLHFISGTSGSSDCWVPVF